VCVTECVYGTPRQDVTNSQFVGPVVRITDNTIGWTDARLCGPKRVGAEWTAVAAAFGRSGRRQRAMGSSAEVNGL